MIKSYIKTTPHIIYPWITVKDRFSLFSLTIYIDMNMISTDYFLINL